MVLDPRSQRVRRARVLLRYLETIGDVISRNEARVVVGTSSNVALDSILADATELDVRLYEGKARMPTVFGHNKLLTVYGLDMDGAS